MTNSVDRPETADAGPTTPAQATPAKRWSLLREVVETAVVAVLIYTVIRTLILPYEVEGASMDPTMHDSDRLLVSRQAYAHVDFESMFGFLPWVDGPGGDTVYPFGRPERGDVIVFTPPVSPGSDKPYVKRIIGLPGERITFQDGLVRVNGVPLDESYIDGAITLCDDRQGCDLGPVPDGMVFVLGDNRQHSEDSRSFGFVDVDSIIGQAVLTNWPIKDFGPLSSGDYDR